MFDEWLLYEAVRDEDEDQVEHLLHEKKIDPNPNPSVPLQDNTLSMACSNGNLNIVRLLITNKDHPADPNKADKVDKDSLTPFLVAVVSQHLDMIKLLLNESRVKVDLSVNHHHVYTPLAMAVQHGNVDVCRLLLEHGSDADDPIQKHHAGIRVIHNAARSGWSHIVKLLLAHGADITSSNSKIRLIRMAMKSRNAENLECCLQYVYSKLGDNVEGLDEMLVAAAIRTRSEAYLTELLHWFLMSNPCKSMQHKSAFHTAASKGSIIAMNMLAGFNSQCLQEEWLVNGNIPNALAEHQAYTVQVLERRKQPPHLQHLCRTKICRQLGCNSVQKVETLRLPRILKDFIQFKNFHG